MNEEKERRVDETPLETVLDEYVATSQGPSYDRLSEWVARYPAYREELTDFTANWSVLDAVPVSESDLAAEDVAAPVERHMSIVRAIMERFAAQQGAAVEGLVAEGKVRGFSMRALADRAGLSVPLLTGLDRRLIRYSTIPGEVVAAIADALGRDVQAIALYLQGGPRLAPGASYRAEEAPSLPDQQSFEEAVRTDRTLTSEQRNRLLALAAQRDVGE